MLRETTHVNSQIQFEGTKAARKLKADERGRYDGGLASVIALVGGEPGHGNGFSFSPPRPPSPAWQPGSTKNFSRRFVASPEFRRSANVLVCRQKPPPARCSIRSRA